MALTVIVIGLPARSRGARRPAAPAPLFWVPPGRPPGGPPAALLPPPSHNPARIQGGVARARAIWPLISRVHQLNRSRISTAARRRAARRARTVLFSLPVLWAVHCAYLGYCGADSAAAAIIRPAAAVAVPDLRRAVGRFAICGSSVCLPSHVTRYVACAFLSVARWACRAPGFWVTGVLA